MQLLKRICSPIMLALGSSFVLTSPASAQLTVPPPGHFITTYASVSAGNLDTNAHIYVYPSVSNSNSTGQPVTATGGRSFTGMDSHGATQTMTLDGTGRAWAEYGRLHAYASARITNPYYNANNPSYYDGTTYNTNGSPQYLQVVGQALWGDTLMLNPFSTTVVGIRYLFHVDGDFRNTDHAYAYLNFHAGFDEATFFTAPDNVQNTWATPTWTVSAGSPIGMFGNFGAVAGGNTNYYNTPEGQTANGIADFYNTLELTSIQLLDANGNQVNGVSYTTASGTPYNVLGGTYGATAAVPEPGSMALLLGCSVMGMDLLRRRRKGSR